MLAYVGLSPTTHPTGTIAVLVVLAGLVLGLVIGSVFGAMVDIRLTPKSEQTQKIADDGKKYEK